MYLIDASYFNREYNIPNVVEATGGNVSLINSYIDDKVRLFIQHTLGYDLFTDLDSNIENGILKSDAPQKWKDFVNGITYTKNDKTYHWKGLLYLNGAFKSSILVPFVYYHFCYDNTSYLSGVGEVVINAKNSVTVGSNQRLVNSWNDFVNQYQGYECGIKPFKNIRNWVTIVDWFNRENNNQYVDLRTFIKHNEEEYPKAPVPLYEVKNFMGI